MGSYKTTIAGGVALVSGFIMFATQAPYNMHFPPWVMALAGFANVLGVGSGLILSKDFNVSGGATIGLPSTEKAIIDSHEVKPEAPKE